MNLEDVLRETPMETLERVRRRLKQGGTSDSTKKDSRKTVSSNGTQASRVSNLSINTVSATSEMNLAAILEASGIDTTKMSSMPINLDQIEQCRGKKDALTLSSLERTANVFSFVDNDSIDESIMHLTAVPIRKAVPRHQSVPSTARSFTSLGAAVSEILEKVSLEGPQVYFQMYTNLKMPNMAISNCVEDTV